MAMANKEVAGIARQLEIDYPQMNAKRGARVQNMAEAIVGDVRGLGMMIGIELVRDRETKEPFARSERVTERALAAARDAGLLLYSSTGHVDGRNGDLLMLGPPFVLTDDDAAALVERTVAAVRSVA